MMRDTADDTAAASTLRSRLAAPAEALSPAARKAVGVGAFALLTALGARIAVPLPGTPVPFTFQVVAVLLAGWMLGPRLGAASQAAYLAAGAAGLPVFAAGGGLAYLLGPTGGYLLAYPAAAALVGLACTRESGWVRQAAGLAGGIAVIHAGGAGWLAAVAGHEAAVTAGVLPFLGVDGIKALLVLLLGRRIGGRARAFFG